MNYASRTLKLLLTSGNSMRTAIGFNADLPIQELAGYASLADNSGFDSIWVHEHSFGRDSISFLSAAAQATRKAKIGVACISVFTRHPVSVAMTAGTLQEYSGGRLNLGIGTGFPARLDLMGVKHEKPIAAIKEAIDICRQIWSGKPVTFSGKAFSIKNVKSLTGSCAKVPIYVAGWKPQMLSLTGRVADGYVAKGGESTISTSQIVTSIKSSAEGASRSMIDIDVAAYLLSYVGSSKGGALERARRDPFVTYMMAVQDDYLYEGTGIDPAKKKPIAENFFKGNVAEASSFVSDEMLEAFTLVGTKNDVVEMVLKYRKAGVKLPILQPISLQHDDISAIISAGKDLLEIQ